MRGAGVGGTTVPLALVACGPEHVGHGILDLQGASMRRMKWMECVMH
jgi:hypothetical protein